ncbi:MAG: hypothetical protein PHT57_14325 [Rhodoferax sp.]|nr:hypothetical protein [Rhodoferax sp.]
MTLMLQQYTIVLSRRFSDVTGNLLKSAAKWRNSHKLIQRRGCARTPEASKIPGGGFKESFEWLDPILLNGINYLPCLNSKKAHMTSSTMQPDLATEPATAQADKPSISSTAPAPSAHVPTPAAVKAVAKRMAKTPAKKVATPVKPVAKVAIKPVPKKAAPEAAVTSKVSTTPTVAAKVAVKRPVKAEPKTAVAPTTKPAEVKLLKAKKPKLVRDSFTIPKLEYLKLEELKHRRVKLGSSIKKSELIRAGIMALAAMSDANFLKATNAVPAIKTGRPAKD